MLRMWMFAVLVASNVHLAHKLLTPDISGPPIAPSMWTIALTSSALYRHHNVFYSKPSQICLDTSIPYSRNVKITWTCRNFASDSGSSPSRSWHRLRTNPVVRYFQHFRWTPVPLALALAYVAYHQFRHTQKREHSSLGSVRQASKCIASELEVSFYKMLPLRAASRWWGWFNSLELPSWLRQPVIRLFVATYGCDISEAACEDLKQYHNLGEFFRRELKPSVRPIHPGDCVVSPADGTVLHFGKVENGHPEQVKGISYSLRSFLGPHTWDCPQEPLKVTEKDTCSDKHYQQSILHGNGDTELYHCIVYLAPGDYHRFHSPADWNILYRRHFPGELLSVRPGVASWIAGLFNVNERVVYYGKWEHGFFSMTAVGATNVGSIKVYFDKDLVTNEKHYIRDTYHDCSFRVNNNSSGVILNKGDPFGEFNLGSTMVLIFEAPKDHKFNIKAGQKIKYGELLCMIEQEMREKEEKR